jgi:hypothetical protein
MKRTIITAVTLLLSSLSFMAQECYTVKMNMRIEGLPAEYAAFGEQEMVNYFKGDKYKSEHSSMMGSSTTAFDGKKLVSISEQMGDKTGYSATKEELEANKNDKSETKPKIEYSSDKKMIAGYECTRATITMVGKDKKEEKIMVWATEKIKYAQQKDKASRRGMGMEFGDLKGYPLEIEIKQDNQGQEIKVMITTKEVTTDTLEDSFFAVNTDGYKMSTYKEQLEKMNAMRARGASN